MTQTVTNIINITYETFHRQIEEIIIDKQIEYIDAIVYWCAKNNVEVEYAASFVKRNQVMKAKIQNEAEKLNYLAKTSKLPVE